MIALLIARVETAYPRAGSETRCGSLPHPRSGKGK